MNDWTSLIETVEYLNDHGFYFELFNQEENMTNVRLYLRNGMFIPCDDDDYEKVSALKRNCIYKCKISNDRNYEFHKKYMGLFKIAWMGLNEQQSAIFRENIDLFRHSIEMAAGCVEPVYDFVNNRLIEGRVSVSFDNMSQKEFEDLFERVKDVLINKVFRRMEDKEFLNMILQY